MSSYYRPRQRKDLDIQREAARRLRHAARVSKCCECGEPIVGKYWKVSDGSAPGGEKYACTRCWAQVPPVQRPPP